jgi:hypothetical protein
MRTGWVIAVLLIAGCASEKLALAPPSGVDFSGHWKLNEADSDDPQRVVLSQNAGAQTGASGSAGQGAPGGQGRGSGRGGRSGGMGGGAPLGPVTPAMSALSDGLRWPGRQLDIEQSAGVVTIASLGTAQVYRPGAAGARNDRETRARDRGGAPAACGWDGKTLVVQSENPDDERPPFEERYSLSDDGQRLVEVVAFKGGRSGGFTVSRVWDRVPAANAVQGNPPGQ